MRTNPESGRLLRQPSWWVVVVAGGLLVIFAIAIVRELLSWHQVRQRVGALRQQVATAQTHQHQLQDLIDYLSSPTFQEREARLQLGLKKSGERVIVVPPSNENLNGQAAENTTDSVTGQPESSHPSRWWSYFFGPVHPSSST